MIILDLLMILSHIFSTRALPGWLCTPNSNHPSIMSEWSTCNESCSNGNLRLLEDTRPFWSKGFFSCSAAETWKIGKGHTFEGRQQGWGRKEVGGGASP